MDSPTLKVVTIAGTRPEVIKLFPVLKALDRHNGFESRFVSTAQHREMIDDLFPLFRIAPDDDLDIIRPNQTLSHVSARILEGLQPILESVAPDLVLVQGDTTTALAGAMAAFNNGIRVAHVEAGLRSHDRFHPFPEEVNRRLISVMGSIHLAPTQSNAENLIREGVDAKDVFITGNTVIDALYEIEKTPGASMPDCINEGDLSGKRLVLVTAHRRENWGEPLAALCRALKTLTRMYRDLVFVYPVHLNPNVRETVHGILSESEGIHLTEPISYPSFVKLMLRSDFIITDSGGIQEEGAALGKPVLVFRETTERNEGIETNGARLLGVDEARVVDQASLLMRDRGQYRKMIVRSNPYGDGYAAQRIVEAIRHHFQLGKRPMDFTAIN